MKTAHSKHDICNFINGRIWCLIKQIKNIEKGKAQVVMQITTKREK